MQKCLQPHSLRWFNCATAPGLYWLTFEKMRRAIAALHHVLRTSVEYEVTAVTVWNRYSQTSRVTKECQPRMGETTEELQHAHSLIDLLIICCSTSWSFCVDMRRAENGLAI